MTYPIINSVGTACPTTATSAAIDTTGANHLVAFWMQWDGVASGVISDNKGNTWVAGSSVVDVSAITKTVSSYVHNPTVGSGHTFTITGGTLDGHFFVFALQGITTASPDKSVNASHGIPGVTSLALPSTTASANNAVVMAAICTQNNSNTGITINGGMNLIYEQDATGSSFGAGVGWLMQGAAAAIGPTWSWTTAAPAASLMHMWIGTAQALTSMDWSAGDAQLRRYVRGAALHAPETLRPITGAGPGFVPFGTGASWVDIRKRRFIDLSQRAGTEAPKNALPFVPLVDPAGQPIARRPMRRQVEQPRLDAPQTFKPPPVNDWSAPPPVLRTRRREQFGGLDLSFTAQTPHPPFTFSPWWEVQPFQPPRQRWERAGLLRWLADIDTFFPIPVPPLPFVWTSLGRWRGAVGVNWKGLALVGDAFTGVVGLSDFNSFTEYGNVMRMLITSPPLHSDRKRIFVPRFEIDMQVGDGIVGHPEEGPQMMLDYSRNGGVTFVGLQKWRSMGMVGQYRRRLRWLNLGEARTWVFRLQCTDNQRRQIIGAYADWFVGKG